MPIRSVDEFAARIGLSPGPEACPASLMTFQEVAAVTEDLQDWMEVSLALVAFLCLFSLSLFPPSIRAESVLFVQMSMVFDVFIVRRDEKSLEEESD